MSPAAPATTLGEAILAGAAQHANSHFIVVSDTRPHQGNLGELVLEATAVAGWLQSVGVRSGDVVALQLPNWWEGAVLQAAAAIAGAVLLPIVPVYGPHELAFILRESRARVLVVPDDYRGRDHAAMLGVLGALPDLLTTVVVGDRVPDGSWRWADLPGDLDLVAPDVDPDQVALLVYTSGTTAAPKGVQHSHRSLLAELGSPIVTAGGGPGSSHLAVFPSGHVAAVNGLMRVLVHGSPTVAMDVWDGDLAVRLVDEYAVTVSAGAPIHLTGFLDARDRGDVSLDSLREYLVGGASVPPSLVARADAAGITVYRSYGLSEHPTISGGTRDDPLLKRATTDGRVAPDNEVRILDEAGREVPTGGEGDIVSRGTELFIGYRDVSLDAEAFTGDGWFRTGDVGRLDADGYLTVTDRKKDIIVRGGENISSKEVEDVLSDHPKVVEAAAVGLPDATYGERVAVFVVLRAGEGLSLDEIGTHFRRAGVARHKTPEAVRTVASFPRTAAGKVQKFRLRELLTSLP